MVQRVHFVFVTMPSDSERTKLYSIALALIAARSEASTGS